VPTFPALAVDENGHGVYGFLQQLGMGKPQWWPWEQAQLSPIWRN
jgi:hypothetical protein